MKRINVRISLATYALVDQRQSSLRKQSRWFADACRYQLNHKDLPKTPPKADPRLTKCLPLTLPDELARALRDAVECCGLTYSQYVETAAILYMAHHPVTRLAPAEKVRGRPRVARTEDGKIYPYEKLHLDHTVDNKLRQYLRSKGAGREAVMVRAVADYLAVEPPPPLLTPYEPALKPKGTHWSPEQWEALKASAAAQNSHPDVVASTAVKLYLERQGVTFYEPPPVVPDQPPLLPDPDNPPKQTKEPGFYEQLFTRYRKDQTP